MAKLSEKAVLDVLAEAPAPVELRALAKALQLQPQDRPELKALVSQMVTNGAVFLDDKRQIRLASHMPEVVMAKVISYDDDGYGEIEILSQDVSADLIARSEISLMPERKRGRIPKIGARILAKMIQYGPDQFEARVLRILPEMKDRFFGRIVTYRGGLGIEVAEKGARRIIQLAKGDETPKLDDLIEAEMLDGKGRIAKAAAMVRNFGSADRADAFIQLAIAEFDIPHVFSDEC